MTRPATPTAATDPSTPADEQASSPASGGPAAGPAAGTSRRLRFGVMAGSFAVVLGAVVAIVLARNGGTFTYAIDDPLIHLTIARDLGRHGTFGIAPGVYESASSAPLWNLLLTPFLALAPGAWWAPLVLEVGAVAWLLAVLSGLPGLARIEPRRLALAVCAAIPVLLGLVPLVLTGMEHALHAALVAQVLVLFARLGTPTERRRDVLAVVGLLAVGTLLRFETAFVAVAAAGVLVLDTRTDRLLGGARRSWTLAATFLGAVAVPAALFAAVNLSFGQYALPNSVVAKSKVASGVPWPDPAAVLDRLTHDPMLLALLVVAGAVLVATRRPSRSTAATRIASRPLLVVLVAAALHLCFADVGWFERYQAYLVVALVVALGLAAPVVATTHRARLRVGVLVLVLAVLRVPLLIDTPTATSNIYEAQYQLGRFFADEYRDDPIAVNDLGYVSWSHDGPILDVVGLGSIDALRARKDGTFDATDFQALATAGDVRIAALFPQFFADAVPDSWQEAGRWCVEGRNVVLWSDCVSFYAPTGEDLARARAALERFAPQLPPGTVSTITSG